MTVENDSPFALLLSGGGARAAYQVGVLAAIAERRPGLVIPILTGVSAGAINIAYLAAHPGPFKLTVESLRGQWLRMTSEMVYQMRTLKLARWALRFTTQVALGRVRLGTVRGVMDMRPLSRFLAAIVDFQGIDANIEAGRLQSVALTATSYSTGQTVTFVHGDPNVTLWQRAQRTAVHTRLSLAHVMASSAIPLIFPAVKIAGHFYGDGSVRQTTPFSPAIHLGAGRILAIGMRTRYAAKASPLASEYPNTAQVVALLFNAIFLDALDADAERLERFNRLLAALPPGLELPERLRRVDLLVLRPSRDLGSLAAGIKLRLPPTFERVVQSMGGVGEGAQEFLSYLLFDPEYTGLLMELGYEDAIGDWSRIEQFLDPRGGQAS
ncbi:MAG: patatin-like phospholipase family protein [Gemmatimonadetes bacterium]|nr:patatin-like phospholipase family protein [Gemmatimonadota bacterium]